MEEQQSSNLIQQPDNQSQAAPEPKHSSFLTSKLFLITLVIIIFVLLLVIGGNYMRNLQLQKQMFPPPPEPSLPPRITLQPSPNQDETSNWKTYTNEELQFSFQYPNDYELDLEDDGYFHPADLSVEKRYRNSRIGSINITNATTILQKCNIKYEVFHDPIHDPEKIIISKEAVNANGISGLKELVDTAYAGDGGPLGQLYINSFCFNKNNKTFTFSLFSYNEIYDGEKKEFDQILSTFKFTDQEKTVCTQDAKLCPDGSYVSRQGPNCEFAKCP